MLLNQIFSAQTIAINRTVTPSDGMPYLLQQYFPDKKKTGLTLSWLKQNKGLTATLKTSNLDATPTIRPRGELKVTNEEMPFFREGKQIKEADLMMIQEAQSLDNPHVDEALDSIYDDANELLEAAETAAEKMRAQLISANGGNMGVAIPMNDNMIHTYDYDPDGTWKSAHYLELTGNDTWDKKDSAAPLDDIQKAIDYLASIGVVATDVLGTSTTFGYLTKCQQVKDALVTVSGQAINFMNGRMAKTVLEEVLGINRISYDKMYEDYDGSQKKFYPDDYVTILGSGQLGNLWHGTTPEERTLLGNPQANVSVLENGAAISIKEEQGPPASVSTYVSQIALPSFEGMDSIFVIKVR